MKFRKLLCCAIAVILILTIMIPTVFAATKCTVTQNVMFRQGPGTNYPAYSQLFPSHGRKNWNALGA